MFIYCIICLCLRDGDLNCISSTNISSPFLLSWRKLKGTRAEAGIPLWRSLNNPTSCEQEKQAAWKVDKISLPSLFVQNFATTDKFFHKNIPFLLYFIFMQHYQNTCFQCFRSPVEVAREKRGEKGVEEEEDEEEDLVTRVMRKTGKATAAPAQPKRWWSQCSRDSFCCFLYYQ